jgi:hypothetical protein
MHKQLIIDIGIGIGVVFALATVAFLVFSLMPSPSASRFIKRWQGRQAPR